jgi:Uma2 family endonuclease
MMVTLAKKSTKKENIIPEALVRDHINGVAFYYRGYKEVLKKKKQLDDVMGTSGLQSLVVSLIFGYLFGTLNRKKYQILTSEVGNHLAKGDNLAFDIAIFEKSVLTPDKITSKYIDVAPKLVIEVDTQFRIETAGINLATLEEYILIKTEKLLYAGVEKVIWVLLSSRRVMVATLEDDTWHISPLHKDIAVLDGIKLNIARFLEEEGVSW